MQEKIPVFFNQLPGGTGLKVYGFLANQIKDRFQKKDFGWRNFEFYGRITPPEYNVTNIQVPSYIIYGVGDWTTTRRVRCPIIYSNKKFLILVLGRFKFIQTTSRNVTIRNLWCQ